MDFLRVAHSRSGRSEVYSKVTRCLKVVFAIVPVVFFACTKETVRTETRIVPERQASPDVRDSLIPNTEEKTIEIQKAALGKAFLLIPTVRSSGRTPEWGDIRPLVVSFERSGNKVGLFRLSSDNVYNTIPTDKLLQSFSIRKETGETLQIDLAQGLRSLDMNGTLDIVETQSFLKNYEKNADGFETAVELKDSLIRSVKEENNAIVIEQVARISTEQIEMEKSRVGEDEKETPSLKKQEVTSTFVFELKPYKSNPEFAQPKLMDIEQRIGYFLNFAYKEGQSLPEPQISRWDFSAQRPPVTVALVQGTPAEVVPAIREGVEYWNHVLGREVLKFQTGLDPKTNPQDRMIIVRWVPWDSAGFAYASAQSDPLTGEVFRGQVFMTSSWYLHGFESFRWPEEFSMKRNSFLSNQHLCLTQQKDFGLKAAFFNASPEVKKKASLEIVRIVLAHEMGHVLGLRHNFAASNVFPGTDQELLERKQNYLSDLDSGKSSKEAGYPLATSVMDYHRAVETAILGSHIKDQTLPYDVDAMSWAYDGKQMTAKKFEYCSDEHIMMANKFQRSIFGCDRFDGFKNPILGELYQARRNLLNLSLLPFSLRVAAFQSKDPYRAVRELKQNDVSFSIDFGDLKTILYSSLLKSGMISTQTIIEKMIADLSALPRSGFSMLYMIGEDSKYVEQLTVAAKEIGGLSGLLKWLLPPEIEKGKFAQNQVDQFFSAIGEKPIEKVSSEELVKMKEIFHKAAEKFDREYEVQLLASFLPVWVKTEYKPNSGKPYDPSETPKKSFMYFSRGMDLGDQKELFERYRKAVVLRDSEILVDAYGQSLKLQIMNTDTPQRSELMKVFVPENWGMIFQYQVANVLSSQKEILKQDLVANTLAILQAGKIEVAKPMNIQNLKMAFEKIDWAQVKGTQKWDPVFQKELAAYEALETLKKEEN